MQPTSHTHDSNAMLFVTSYMKSNFSLPRRSYYYTNHIMSWMLILPAAPLVFPLLLLPLLLAFGFGD